MSVQAVTTGCVALSPLDAGVVAILARKGLGELRRDGVRPDRRIVSVVESLEAAAASVNGTTPAAAADPGMPTPAVAVDVLTVSDLVARTGKSDRTVRQWCSTGRWPSARQLPGGQWVVNAEDLDGE